MGGPTRGDLWGAMRAHGGLWELLVIYNVYGDFSGPMGTYWNL